MIRGSHCIKLPLQVRGWHKEMASRCILTQDHEQRLTGTGIGKRRGRYIAGQSEFHRAALTGVKCGRG
jgi:hypothetical protein